MAPKEAVILSSVILIEVYETGTLTYTDWSVFADVNIQTPCAPKLQTYSELFLLCYVCVTLPSLPTPLQLSLTPMPCVDETCPLLLNFRVICPCTLPYTVSGIVFCTFPGTGSGFSGMNSTFRHVSAFMVLPTHRSGFHLLGSTSTWRWCCYAWALLQSYAAQVASVYQASIRVLSFVCRDVWSVT